MPIGGKPVLGLKTCQRLRRGSTEESRFYLVVRQETRSNKTLLKLTDSFATLTLR